MIKNKKPILVNVNYSVRSTTIKMTASKRCGGLTDSPCTGRTNVVPDTWCRRTDGDQCRMRLGLTEEEKGLPDESRGLW